MRIWLGGLIVVLLACTPMARAAGPSLGLGAFPFYEDPQKVYAWEGSFTATEVHLPSHRDKASLYGVLFRPKPAPRTKLPGVVIVPGSGPGVQSFYQWAARDLAGHGYVALTVDPQGVGRSDTFAEEGCCRGVPFQQAFNYADAYTSGLDFITKHGADPRRLGIAGHSLAARAGSWVQGRDGRVKALVAWDNLATLLEGDAGSASGGGVAGELIGGELPSDEDHPVTPRVPSLGMASDRRGTLDTTGNDPDQKKTGFKLFASKHVPTMELVFAGVVHDDFAQTRRAPDEATTHLFAYYTRAWFDRYLRGSTAAKATLLARTVLGKSRASFLSTKFRSAAAFDGVTCQDLRRC